jgi:hypothetical protein
VNAVHGFIKSRASSGRAGSNPRSRALRGNPVFINPAPNAKVHFFQMFLQS